MSYGKMQESRFELKYFLTEDKALRMRDFVHSYLDVDEYAIGQPNNSYPTLSLYLDSDDLYTYGETINGSKNRFKLRLRYYDDNPNSPVFFEIKRRVNNVILKQRAGVRKSAVRWLISGQFPTREHLLHPDSAEEWMALQRFVELMTVLNAKPKMHVTYLREAYENPGNNAVRLTFDRTVESAPYPQPSLIAKALNPHRVFGPYVVLELKFTDRFPNWFREMVEAFDCSQTGAAKFAEGIFAKGEHWVRRGCTPTPEEAILNEFLGGQ